MRLIKYFSEPAKIYFFVIELVGSLTVIKYFSEATDVISILGMSALIAFAVAAALSLFRPIRPLYKAMFVLFAVLLNLLTIADIFCLTNFDMPISQDIVDIVAETNRSEIAGFLDVYLDIWQVILWGCVIIMANAGLYALLKRIRGLYKLVMGSVFFCLCVIGLISMSFSVYSYVRYHNGASIPQYSNLTRVTYSLYVVNDRMKDIDRLASLCDSIKSPSVEVSDSTIYVVIIGESLSAFHSSLYGYDKVTNPRLSHRLNDGELVKYDDAVSIADHTHTAMKSIFSLSDKNEDFSSYPLFPAIFKKAGYYTSLYDNQYFEDEGVSFLSDKELSNIMFDHRNPEAYEFDGTMIDDVLLPDRKSLIVLHLIGQHYTYSDRYPQSMTAPFDAEMYTAPRQEYKSVMAAYDNAVYYNDSIVDRLMTRLEGRLACVVYFSDHGEEIYEFDDFMGHGNAAYSAGMQHQIKVPLLIWGSEDFRNTQQWQKIVESQSRRVTTDDISHTLIDMAGISTPWLQPDRSFINDAYNERHRIVLNSIDYDVLD